MPHPVIAGPARPKNWPGREAVNVSAVVTAASDQRRGAVASHEQLRGCRYNMTRDPMTPTPNPNPTPNPIPSPTTNPTSNPISDPIPTPHPLV